MKQTQQHTFLFAQDTVTQTKDYSQNHPIASSALLELGGSLYMTLTWLGYLLMGDNPKVQRVKCSVKTLGRIACPAPLLGTSITEPPPPSALICSHVRLSLEGKQWVKNQVLIISVSPVSAIWQVFDKCMVVDHHRPLSLLQWKKILLTLPLSNTYLSMQGRQNFICMFLGPPARPKN